MRKGMLDCKVNDEEGKTPNDGLGHLLDSKSDEQNNENGSVKGKKPICRKRPAYNRDRAGRW